jgi:tetratricopeptide (TPR) repeat protein
VRGGKGLDALATVESLRKLKPPLSEQPLIDLQEAAAWEELGDIKRQEEPLSRAVELARQQGSRLILARARNSQRVMFSYLEQPQNAIAACRESRDIYAAAGNAYGEANSLASWADAIGDRDAPEAIRLYQQAQTVYRQVGCESGVASVLNNIGIVYGAQGDLALAEKMYRQALESFRLLDNKRNQARVTGNVADERMEQGDLRGAIQLYQAALQLDRETADTGSATMIGYDLAVVHQLQGDLAGAKQELNDALHSWQKSGDRNASAYGMWRLGNVLLQEADLSRARTMYEQALAIRTSAGDKFTMAQVQLALADLSLEEAHAPAEQEAATHQVIEVFQKQKARDDEIQAWCVLARAMLAQDKAAAASDAIEHARSLAGKSQNPEVRWRTALATARLYVAGKDQAHTASGIAAQKELNAVVQKSRELGYLGIELDARLALAEIEMKEGQTTAGRARLAAIESDAKAKGYHLVARKAARVHG